MRIIIFSFLSIFFCFGNNLNDYINSKIHLSNVIKINSFVTSNSESTIGSNKILIMLYNKEGKEISFYVLKDQPIIITSCDFDIKRNKENNFILEIDKNCSDYLSKEAQDKYIFNILNSIDKKIEYIYNKGDIE